MADRPADRRSVQDFVRKVVNAVTSLQTRSNQRGNNEESSRAEFESITDEVNAQFQISRQGSRGRRTATATTSTIRDLKQPGRVRGRRREKTSEVLVENVVQSGKNKCLSKLPSRLVAEEGRLH